jgi:hypothetical protein
MRSSAARHSRVTDLTIADSRAYRLPGTSSHRPPDSQHRTTRREIGSYAWLSSRHGPRQYWQRTTASQPTMTSAATALARNPSSVSHVTVTSEP